LFKPGDTKGIEYSGSRSVDSFCDFIENYTTFKAKRPPKVLHELNPISFDNFTNARKCTFVTFYAPWCGHCKHFMPQAKIAATAFQYEKDAAVARLDCDKYDEFCKRFEVTGFPTIKLIKDGEAIAYTGARTAEAVCDFINENCGTERAATGLLNDKAGIIPEATEIAKQFISENSDKNELIERMKAIKGADFYVKVMLRYLKGGAEQINKDISTISIELGVRQEQMNCLTVILLVIAVLLTFIH